MFPQEITSTSVWIRHGLPLYAPSPPDGDKKLQRQIRQKHPNVNEDEINTLILKERCHLNLKWCFDEYFGCPIRHPTLGQIVTANVFGTVHLGYIVNITRSTINLVSARTFIVLPEVNHDDIYSADYSPFFENYLHNQRVYHSQHILDWWSQSTYVQHPCTNFSSSTEMLSPACPDIHFDWPVDNEIWFIHDVLPPRSNLSHCHDTQLSRVSIIPSVENMEQQLVSFSDSSPILTDQLMCTINHVVTPDLQLSHSLPRFHQQSYLLVFPAFKSRFVRQLNELVLLSILFLCLISTLLYPVKPYDESVSHPVVPTLSPGFSFTYTLSTQFFGCLLILYDTNYIEWFRSLAVP